MKNCIILFIFACLAGCTGRQQADTDVIHLTLTKSQDTVSRPRSASGFLSEEKNPFPGIHPETVTRIPGWKNSQLYYNDIDFPQLLFQAYKAGRVSQELCMEYFRGWGRDTNSCSPVERKGYFALLTGEGEDGLEYVVADGNGNFDFTDDRVQPLSAATSPVKVVFERFDGNRPVTDSSWILPRRLSGDEAFLYVQYREKTETTFSLEGKNYICRMIPSGLQYGEQRTSIECESSDTLLKCAPNEYLKLGDAYYKADSVGDDGRYLRLSRVKDTASMAGTQVGFPPIPFTVTATDGRILRFPGDFKGKYVLLDFWATTCGPCRDEIRNVYPALYERYKAQGFEILGIAADNAADIAAFSRTVPLPWPVVAERDQQTKPGRLYNINGYPSLFLISPGGRILYKGDILRGEILKMILDRIFKPEQPENERL